MYYIGGIIHYIIFPVQEVYNWPDDVSLLGPKYVAVNKLMKLVLCVILYIKL
jgi:hypothetical protein